MQKRLFALWVVLLAAPALARIGGGEHFDSGNRDDSGGGGDASFIVELLLWLIIRHPTVGIPLTVIAVVGYVVYRKLHDGDTSTRKAIDRAESARRTQVSASAVDGWVQALKRKDPAFDLMALFDRVRREFLELQQAWFVRDLSPVRRLMSDATYQRLVVQLSLLRQQGVRDAITDAQVLDLQIIGLEQNESFDSVHVRVTAQLRDGEASAEQSDEEALAIAKRSPLEKFTEVWSFVRRPDARTKVDGDVSQGKCPNCGAPFAGGASNTCEFCGAIVNSGTHDWVLAEITQGSQHQPHGQVPEGYAKLRQLDPHFSTELLEDRASLLFWRWVEAQAFASPALMAKVAAPELTAQVGQSIAQTERSGKVKRFIDCAVGGVTTQSISISGEREIAAVEIRWSAKIAALATGAKVPPLPSQPQRSVMVLERKRGAQTNAERGMATNRCPNCNAPLSDNGQPSCEFCGQVLASGERDWVMRDFGSWEWWRSSAPTGDRTATKGPARVPDREERERLVYVMAAMAASDGTVDAKERQLLKMASERWGVSWANVELALSAPPDTIFERMIAKGSQEAESFLDELVQVALADGKIDSKERKMLEAAAAHLGLQGSLGSRLRA